MLVDQEALRRGEEVDTYMVDFLSIRVNQFLSPDNKGFYDSWLDDM
jgi:hypothetical protein